MPWCSILPTKLLGIATAIVSFYSGFDPKVSRQRSISSQLYHLGGRCRLGCWPCVFSRRCRRFKSWTACLQGSLLALCSLRFGFVSSIFGGLKYVLPQRALVLPAMGVPYSSSSSVRDTDYVRETQKLQSWCAWRPTLAMRSKGITPWSPTRLAVSSMSLS
jgi:hypothetical protein